MDAMNEPDWRDEFTWVTHRTPFITFWKWVGHVVFWPVYTVTWHGLENLPATGPCILASNHVSNYDPTVWWVFLEKRDVHFMAKIELFSNPLLRWLLSKSGAFPVKRGEGDHWAVHQAGRILQEGQVLGMFPEGTRSRTACLKRAKVGTVRLAITHNVPIIPAAIQNTHKIRAGRARVPVHVRIGRPLYPSEAVASLPPSHELLERLTEQLMRTIATMLPAEQRGIYD